MRDHLGDKFSELEALRRKRDWTYRQLAEEIAAVTAHHRDPDCWRKICLGETPAPQATTLYILDQFLASFDKQPRRRVS